MTPERFEQIVDEVFDMCRAALVNRAKMYSHNNDRLSNFKRAADFQEIPAIHALLGMATKQLVSIYDYADDTCLEVEHTREQWLEKITDSINYLGPLLLALLEDEGEME